MWHSFFPLKLPFKPLLRKLKYTEPKFLLQDTHFHAQGLGQIMLAFGYPSSSKNARKSPAAWHIFSFRLQGVEHTGPCLASSSFPQESQQTVPASVWFANAAHSALLVCPVLARQAMESSVLQFSWIPICCDSDEKLSPRVDVSSLIMLRKIGQVL